jgi:hypothetical protein
MSLAEEISIEIERAEAARAAGNEGRARVCARRAAGLAARDFLDRNQIPPNEDAHIWTRSNKSAYDALQAVAFFPALATHLKQAALHLTTRVNGEFHLPDGTDLIEEARKIIGGLK